MKTTFLKTSIATVLMGALLLVACDSGNDLTSNEDEEAEIAEVSSVAENESDEVLEMADDVESSLAAEAAGRSNEWDYPCAEVVKDTVAKTLTIDFGTSCVGPYGRTRSGKIIIAYSGEINDGISNRIITFENYVVNNRSVEGQIELRDIQENTDGTVQSTKKMVELTVTFPNGQSVTYNGSRTRVWTEGVRDGDPSNNVFEITGSVEAVWSTGRTFTHTIVEPIIVDWSCAAAGSFARVDGLVEIEKLNGFISRKRTIDYGDGNCDNVITITIGDRTFEITEID